MSAATAYPPPAPNVVTQADAATLARILALIQRMVQAERDQDAGEFWHVWNLLRQVV